MRGTVFVLTARQKRIRFQDAVISCELFDLNIPHGSQKKSALAKDEYDDNKLTFFVVCINKIIYIVCIIFILVFRQC